MAGRHRSHEAALARSQFLGESIASACYVVGTNTGPVIDECSPTQQTVRALLALLALNDSQPGGPLNQTSAAALVSYSFTQSPRRNALLIVSSSPDNIAQRLLGAHCGFRFAGEAWMQTKSEHDVRRLYRLEHAPSGAVVISTSDTGLLRSEQCDPSESSIRFTRWNVGVPQESREAEANEFVEKLSTEARALLAALFVRLNARGGRSWAVGEFWWDPLDRPMWKLPGGRPSTHRRSLRETGAGWELRWDGPPLPSDVVAAFTHPVCGLRGAHALGQDADREREIVYGATRLLLRPF